MGERHDAEREIAQARERLSEIAEELSRRASGPYIKAQAREFADEMTERAKVKARERTVEMKDRLLDSPWALGLIGGTVGAIAGKVIGERTKRARFAGRDYGWDERYLAYQEKPYDEYTATHRPRYGYESEIITEDQAIRSDQSYGARGEGEIGRVGFEGDVHLQRDEGLKARAQEKLGNVKGAVSEKASAVGDKARGAVETVKEKAQELSGAASEKLHGVRDRLPDVREKMPSRDQFREGGRAVLRSTSEHENLWALGALAVGAFFGLMVPVTEKERMMFRPVKESVEEELGSIKDEAISTAKNIKENVTEALTQAQQGQQNEQQASNVENVEEEEESSGYVSGTQSEPTYHASGSIDVGSPEISEDENDLGYGQRSSPGVSDDAGALQSAPGTFSTGGISEGGTLEEKREQTREGGIWTPAYDPDVTKH